MTRNARVEANQRPAGTLSPGLVDAVGRRLAVDPAVHSSNEAECQRLITQARLTVGDETFPGVLYVALGSLATGIVGPMLEAADSAGWTDARRLVTDRAARLRRVVDRAVGKP